MGENNLYRRGGIWWLRATVRGAEYRESLRTRDVKAARKARDTRIEALTQAAGAGRAVMWLEAVASWAEATAGHFSANTARRYGTSLLMVEPFLMPLDVAAIDGKAINTIIKERRKQGVTEATIRRDLTAVSRVLEHAEAEEWREGNPTLSKRKTVKERRDPITLPTREAIEQVIAEASPRFAAFIKAAEFTGCRQDELVKLPARSFNPKRSTLTVIGKGNKRRTIDLSEAATAHFSAQPRTLGSALFFTKEDGSPFDQAASDFTHLKRAVRKKLKALGIEFQGFRFHDLRHLFAVDTLRSGTMDIYKLSKHLGHTSVKTTEIYLDFLSPEEQEIAKHGVGTKYGTVQAVLPVTDKAINE